MKNKEQTLTPKLIKRLWIAFALIILLMGVSYVFITGYFANKYSMATAQRIDAHIADHLIQEMFQNDSPFLEDGSVNESLFSDLMHDMMAINQSIEVYLLDKTGIILYSVVLNHKDSSVINKVALEPINSFIASNGENYTLGDDPRNPGEQEIFSAAKFNVDGHEGYIYIILAGKEFHKISETLLGQYFSKLGIGAAILTMLFASIIALLSIWFLTKNLRLMIDTVRRFQEGELSARIENPANSDIEFFAHSFNSMADTIVANIDKIKYVDSQRRDLVANVSHDLRTPLAILKGYVETLQIKRDSLSESDKQEYLQITHDNIDKLSNLINQLFEYSKLETEQITPVKEPFSITELSHDLIAKFKIIANEKNIILHLENPNENSMVFADVSLVERALQNLIENALKYTEPNGKITLSIERKLDNIEINITDTGKGIPFNEQAYIFDRFKQVEKGTGKQGYGLGLAIVKKIMDLHETTITVLSKPKVGSSFIFNLPAYSG
ncbi:sensor histidine kinase [Arenibacter sp. TNZ]|uniref:sensor histidine kinase n=1 Tax=Arenibacter TaxID=178469 RepID=UPI000CD44E4C|nr:MULTISPECIES: HAMP domain-containing sensor histidine kinase [Arenibacter]MCM4171049.1 sensor histidine kinase [Arenibacter sp. TNZ]